MPNQLTGRIFSLVIMVLALGTLRPDAANGAPIPGTYQLQFIVLTTSSGTPTFSEARAKEQTARLDAAYREVTRGKLRFAFNSYTTATWKTGSAEDACKTKSVHVPLKGTIPELPNGIKVVVTSLNCASYGEMPGTWTAINGAAAVNDLSVLAHEIGHTFGLSHANAMYFEAPLGMSLKQPVSKDVLPEYKPIRNNVYQTWVDTAPINEYGDSSSTMGSYYGDERVQFNAYELDQLGVLEKNDIGAVIDSGTFTITERNRGNGVKILYIPIESEIQASIELWNGSDSDFSGVQVRALYIYRYGPGIDSIIQASPVQGTTRFGLQTGNRLDLHDGTVIVVDDLNEASARVRITRPVDALAPKIYLNENDPCRERQTDCTITISTGTQSPPFTLSFDNFRDDRWLASYGVLIDGKQGPSVNYPGADTPQLSSWQRALGNIQFTLGIGEHNVEIYAVDVSGNRSSVTRKVTIRSNSSTTTRAVENQADAKPAPSSLSIKSLTRSTVSLIWFNLSSDPSSIGHKIEYRAASSKTMSVVTFAPGVKAFTIKGLKPKTRYYIWLYAISKVGESYPAMTTVVTRS